MTSLPPRQLTAAASRYSVKTTNSSRVSRTDSSWQQEAWRFFKEVPEVRFAGTWVGNAMSGATLFAGRRADDGTIERAPDNHRAAEIVREIAGGPDGQSNLLADFGPHLVVAGEGWIVVRPTAEDANNVDGYDWRVLSTREVKQQGGGKLTAEIDGEDVPIPPYDPDAPADPMAPIAIRVWKPSPDRHIEADSPVRSSLVLLEELQLLNAAVAAIARSRITGRGVLLVPKGTRFPTSPGTAGDAEDDLLEVFLEVASTAIREPDSAAATVPIILEVPAEAISDIKWMSFESNFDELALKLRDEAIRRFANGLEVPAEILLGLSDANHWCTLPETEIMTARGWKTYDQLTPGELVLTLNHETGLSEWQPLQKVNTWQVTDERMIRMKGKRHHSVTTAGHRWPVQTGHPNWRKRSWTTSGELAVGLTESDAPQFRNTFLVTGAPSACLPAEQKYSDALVELVAWYFTEGSNGTRPGRNTPKVVIHQSHLVNADNCARIERALTHLFGPASDRLDKGGRYSSPESAARRAEARRLHIEHPDMSNNEIGRQIGVSGVMVGKYLKEDAKTRDDVPRWRKKLNSSGDMTHYVLNSGAAGMILEHAPGRVVSPDFVRALSQAQLELFIDTAVRGDGWHIGNTPALSQKDPAMLDAFELAVILSGRTPLRHEHTSEGISANGPRTKTQHIVTAGSTTTFAPQTQHITEETYSGTIWCPTTPNGTWLARYDGTVFYTGNSAWAISAEAVRLGVEPRLAIVCHALTTQWLRPLLEDEAVEDPDEWLVWYDTSQLRVQANRAQTALEAYQAGLISAAAARRETGFDEADAPTAEEAAQNKNADQAPADNPDEETPSTVTTLPVGETTSIPDTLPASAAHPERVLAAVDGLIWAALQAAGERLRNKPACPRSERARAREIVPAELHTVFPVEQDMIDAWHLLDGAWARVPEIARRYGLNPECLTGVLDDYARALIAARHPHTYEDTARVLRAPCIAEAA
ncbi:Hint domain-containing protein [Streptomyces sp. NPDC001076]